MELVQAVILALVQGFTEFFPISSSGHLILTSRFLEWEDQGLSVDIALHFGSLLAILFYFRKKMFVRGGEISKSLFINLVVAVMPIVIVAPFLADLISGQLRSPLFIACLLIIFACILFLAQRFHGSKTVGNLNWQGALCIGSCQILALFPGVSRSGITMSAGMLVGLTPLAAVHFSFYLAVPTILGAATLQLYRIVTQSIEIDIVQLATAISASAVFSYSALVLLVSIIQRFGVMPFVIYRIILGMAILSLSVT